MSLDTIETTFRRIFESTYADEDLTIIWHAGEPLVLPVSYYETAFQSIERLRPTSVRLRHSFQTNGTLLNKAWCDLFRRWNVGLGLSIDGPRSLHNANRITRAGKGTFDQAMRGARLLKAEGIRFHIISVLSQAALHKAGELHSFYLEEGFHDVCFNVEESEGDHVSTLMQQGKDSTRLQFLQFLQTFWTLSREAPGIDFIREIDGIITRIFRPEEAKVGNDQVEPLAMMNVDCKGNVGTFSPELLGYRNERYHDFLLGNVHTHTLEQMLHSEAMEAMAIDIRAGVEACRQECDYFSLCGGGAPVNKLAETGSFASTETSFCNLVQIVPADLVLRAFSQMEQSLVEVSQSDELLPACA